MKIVNTSQISTQFKPRTYERSNKNSVTSNLRKLSIGESLVISSKDISAKNPKASVSTCLTYFKKKYGVPGVKYQLRTLVSGDIAINCVKK